MRPGTWCKQNAPGFDGVDAPLAHSRKVQQWRVYHGVPIFNNFPYRASLAFHPISERTQHGAVLPAGSFQRASFAPIAALTLKPPGTCHD